MTDIAMGLEFSTGEIFTSTGEKTFPTGEFFRQTGEKVCSTLIDPKKIKTWR